jgi:ATP-dependent RNA helicase RhlE
MLDMGFLPAIEKILSVLPQSRQSMFFSATMEKEVERLIARHSKNPVRIAVGNPASKASEQVDLHFYEVENDMKLGLLQHMLKEEDGSFLVFSRTKHGTDRLAKKLSALGLRSVAMHGNRTQNQRNQALAGFRDGRYRVLVATDVAARGIHVDNVAHVINFDLPQTPDDFIHRIGRTGRAGQRGSASTFVSRSERGEMRRIERECKVRLMRREITPEMLQQFAEQAKHEPVIDQQVEHHSPLARAHHKGGPSFGGGSSAGPKRRSFGPPRRFTQSAGRP